LQSDNQPLTDENYYMTKTFALKGGMNVIFLLIYRLILIKFVYLGLMCKLD